MGRGRLGVNPNPCREALLAPGAAAPPLERSAHQRKPARRAAREFLGKYANGYFAYMNKLVRGTYPVKGKSYGLYNFYTSRTLCSAMCMALLLVEFNPRCAIALAIAHALLGLVPIDEGRGQPIEKADADDHRDDGEVAAAALRIVVRLAPAHCLWLSRALTPTPCRRQYCLRESAADIGG